ncbi:hypothetical protein LXA43DRAFT_1057181 [Ganoderma leucocontextum]|nr:hypothetical protein LXA43DRAFT_1057181 [Ganoderma leucocontextum]
MSHMILPASHLLTYGILLGTTIYQTFVITKVAYLALPTSAFTTLQKKVFPAYFRLQSLLLVATALTYPPASVLALCQEPLDAGLLAFAGVTAFANLAKYGPATTTAMVARIHQETRDGKKHDDPSGVSEEMRLKNRAFSRNHAMSIHLNLLSVIATVAYGVRLASRLKF